MADARRLEYYDLRSVTLKRADLDRGIEPDACFYFEKSAFVDIEAGIDLAVSPPPDLAIEIDISNLSLDKLPIYEALRVTELWRWRDHALTIYVLNDEAYAEADGSRILHGVTARQITDLITRVSASRRWHREIREWAESLVAGS